MSKSDLLGVGLYSVSEAARLLQVHPTTVRRWLDGYTYPLRDGLGRYEPVVKVEPLSKTLVFRELMELRAVAALRREKVAMRDIREASKKLRDILETTYPLANKRVASLDRRILHEQDGIWTRVADGQTHLEIVQESLKTLDFDKEGIATAWHPIGKEHSVLVDPERAFGKPIDAFSGVKTFTLVQALKSESEGGEVSREVEAMVARAYEVSLDSLRDAVRFEAEFGGLKLNFAFAA